MWTEFWEQRDTRQAQGEDGAVRGRTASVSWLQLMRDHTTCLAGQDETSTGQDEMLLSTGS